MTLLSPWSLAWLGLLVPLVVLYILKRRRAERTVGSTLLWELALRDMRAERPWKRLVPHLSLLLQILALVAGAIALARPGGAGGIISGARLAVVVDTSASMAARDGDTTRLGRARDVAASLARSLPPGGDMMLIEASAEPAVVSAPTRDARALEAVLERLEVRGTSADLEAAVSLAVERLRGAPDGSRIVVLTDAASDGEIALDGRTAPVEVQRVGEAIANDAIVALDVRARASEEHPDRADVFARIRHYGDGDSELFLTASTERGGVIASRRITVAHGESETVILPVDLPPDAGGRAPIVRVEIAPVTGADDAFALDDVAFAPSPASARLPVFLIGRASPPVERVLRADPGVELFTTTLRALASREPDAPPLDGLFVYVGEVPDAPPPGDAVVVAPEGDSVFGAALGEAAEAPAIVTWADDDARMRFAALADLHIIRVRPIRAPAAVPLLTTDAGPVIAVLPRPDGETTLVAFDPADSDWPRQESYVVFFRNLLERARSRRAAGGVPPGRIGEALRVPGADGAEIRVTTPSGRELTTRARGGAAVLSVAAEAGVYRVSVAGREMFALRNLLDPEESDLAPRARFTRSDREAVGAAAAAERAESWPWLAGALLLFLFAEAIWATWRRGPSKREKSKA